MAITVSNNFITVMGDRVVGLAKLTLDGTATTVNLPTGKIDVAFVLQQVGTHSTGTTVSWSGKTITISDSGSANETEYVYWIGSA